MYVTAFCQVKYTIQLLRLVLSKCLLDLKKKKVFCIISFLDSTYKGCHMIFLPLCLADFNRKRLTNLENELYGCWEGKE